MYILRLRAGTLQDSPPVGTPVLFFWTCATVVKIISSSALYYITDLELIGVPDAGFISCFVNFDIHILCNKFFIIILTILMYHHV
jgi:hypothetical protein